MIGFPGGESQGEGKCVNQSFSQMIEAFCEILVLYRELFVGPKNLNDDPQNPGRSSAAQGETLLKSLINPGKAAGELDLDKMELVCKQLLAKLGLLKEIERKNGLKAGLKTRIKKLSENISFSLEDMKVFHGDPSEYQSGGRGHLLDLENNFEYLGRVKAREPAGKGKKWVPGAFTVEGYFEEGRLCGFGQKVYIDGSLYR